MKKLYVKPETQTINIEPTMPLAASDLGHIEVSDDFISDDTPSLAPKHDFVWGDEDDE